MSIVATVCLILLCFVIEGFFSGSEIALVSADRLKLQGDADAGRRGSARALKMLDRPAWSLGTCLLGTNLCTQTATFLAASLVVQVGARRTAVTVDRRGGSRGGGGGGGDGGAPRSRGKPRLGHGWWRTRRSLRRGPSR